jgi:hypothetical protein
MDTPNMRRTMELGFRNGKLHQLWQDDEQIQKEWRPVPVLPDEATPPEVDDKKPPVWT